LLRDLAASHQDEVVEYLKNLRPAAGRTLVRYVLDPSGDAGCSAGAAVVHQASTFFSEAVPSPLREMVRVRVIHSTVIFAGNPSGERMHTCPLK